MWAEISAKDFCASVRDGTHDSPKPVESGRYLITSRHIIGGKIDLSNAYLISNEDFEAINKRSKVDRWDVLISMIGTVGEPCLVREDPEFAIKNIGLFKTKSELDGKWLYYYLTSPQAQALIRQHSRGTTQAYVPLGALRDFPVRVPNDEGVKRAITYVLGKLDDKIDLNRRINQTLEAMAQAIFKSWFVDFDPVKAKIAAIADGRDPLRAAMSAISGKPDAELDALPPQQYEQLAATAALFPDEMEESELGKIPMGWNAGTIGDLASVTIGGDWGKDQPENEEYAQAVCLRGVDLEHLRTSGDCPKAPIRWVKKTSIEKRLIQSTDLLIGGSGAGPCGRPLYASPLLAGLVDHPVIYSNFVKRFRCKSSSQAIYLDRILWGLFDGGEIQNYINGTSVPNLNDKGLMMHPILLPGEQLLNELEKVSENWLRNLYSSESRILADLRDTLLPKLLCGELSVTEAIAEAEA